MPTRGRFEAPRVCRTGIARRGRACVIEEDLRQFIEAVEVERGVFPHHQGSRTTPVALEESEERFGSTDVTREEHGQMLTSGTDCP